MPLIEMTGEVFGDLTVIERDKTEKSQAYWRCRCTCGGEISVAGKRLRMGTRTDCGCKTSPDRPKKPKDMRCWVVERDGMVALVHTLGGEDALVEFDMAARAWVCSECGPGRCGHVTAVTLNLPRDTALAIASIIAPKRDGGSLATNTGGAKDGEGANQRAQAEALAKSANARASRAAEHDSRFGAVTSEVVVRQMTDEDCERLALRRAAKAKRFESIFA